MPEEVSLSPFYWTIHTNYPIIYQFPLTHCVFISKCGERYSLFLRVFASLHHDTDSKRNDAIWRPQGARYCIDQHKGEG